MCLLFMLIQICFPFPWVKNKCLMMNNDLNLLSRNDGDFQSRQLLLCSLRVHWGSACYSWTVFIHSLHRRHIQANNSKNRIVMFYGISTRIIKMNLVDIDTCIMLLEHVCSCRCYKVLMLSFYIMTVWLCRLSEVRFQSTIIKAVHL